MMNPLRRNNRSLLATLLALALTLTTSTAALAQQEPQRDNNSDNQSSIISSILSLGSSILSSATGASQYDPYAEFRGARYSNEGLMSERDEIRLGDQIHLEVAKKYSFTTEGQERVNRIGQRVARASQRPNLVYRFHIIQSRELNAFSTPGGHVYITNTLVRTANDDELASVLSHEVGHVVARHSLKSFQQSQALGGLADIFGSITGIAGETAGNLGKAAASIVAGGLLATHSREQEREADFLGIHGMVRAGFNPNGMITIFQKVQQAAQSEPDIVGSIFSDHPDVQERIENTQYEINHIRSTPARARRRR